MSMKMNGRLELGRIGVWAATVACTLGASALTVERLYREINGTVRAELAFDAATADRNVVVAWGASDAGTTYTSWSQAEFALGGAGAGATSCRVTVPSEVASAASARFFLVPTSAQPAYLRATGKQYITTDFYPTPASKIVADYQWDKVTPTQQRIFGCKLGLVVHHYINGSGGLSWSFSNSGNWTALDNTTFIADTSRVTITLDAKGDRVTLVKNGVTAYDKSMKSANSSSPGTQNATAPLHVFATAPGSDNYGAARLYSLECYADGVLAQSFTPCLSGNVAGLRDSVTGKFYADDRMDPFWAGAPVPAATVSDSSAAVDVAAELAKLTVSAASAGAVCLSFGASSAAREIWCAWDETDKGDTFGAWSHNEYVATPATNAATASCPLPPGAVGAKYVRFFLLAAGGNYPCTYVRGDGRQAVDTGILVGTHLAISVDFLPRCLDVVQQRVFGIPSVTNNFVQVAYINGGGCWAWAAKDHVGNWTSSGVSPEMKRTTITLDAPNDRYAIAVEGQTVYSCTISSVVPAASRTIETGAISLPILCGKTSDGSYNQPMQAELYGATLTTNGTPARTLTPCVVDGVAGMRDAVSGAFFGNAITNGATQFIPGGRTDAPTALAAAETVEPAAACDDVFADARFWLRGMGKDIDGNGLLDVKGTTAMYGEIQDTLRRTTFSEIVYGRPGFLPRFTNELVRMPGRGVARQMQTLYLPQTVVITNETTGKGYVNATTLSFPGTVKDLGNRWSFIVRAKADMETAPASSSQWLVKFGHSGKQGVMIGFSGTGAHSRSLALYSTGSGLVYSGSPFAGITITNGWFDLAVVADGQRLTVALMKDGNELNGTDGDKQIGWKIASAVLDPKYNLAPADTLVIGAEEVSNGVRAYPMGSNDNCLKAFRGSIQQFAVWNRALTTAEIFAAFGWPRTDLWRMGVADGFAAEFRGEAAADGVAVDAETWPIQDGVSSAKPLVFKFPIDGELENLCGQLFRWKALPGSAEGRLELTLNGQSLGRKSVKSGAWSQWFVPAAALVAGTNTATLTRVDTGTAALVPDVVALGGGVQVGKANKSYGEFVQENYGLKHLYAADGNLHDVRRVLYCQKNANSNFYWHVSIPAEMVNDRQRWRFTLGTIGSNLGTLTSHPISIDLNGMCLGTKEMVNNASYTFDIDAADVVAGENVFNFRNGAPAAGSYYLGIDYFTLEPLRPVDATFLIIR